MKKFLILVIMSILIQQSYSQVVNGEVLYSDEQFEVIVVSGTHQERGYAVGYLLAEKIDDLFNNYLMPAFGSYYETGRLLIQSDEHISIDQVYIEEAQALADGINATGLVEMEFDYIDVLLANSFLDLQNFIGKDLGLDNGCSTFINWGDATSGTSVDGESILSRHLDWSSHQAIIRNQVMVIHIPSEENLKPWLLIGFAGQMSVLSGLNSSGVAVMQHVLSDVSASASLSKAYEPIWFSLRKAIEYKDYNGDGTNDALDINAVISEKMYGYADSYIITGVAPYNTTDDNKTATIIEVAPALPYITIRNTEYDDDIPGSNLYAANYSIARNNLQHYCTRYNGVKNNMGAGTMIGPEENWNVMLDYSSMCALHTSGNIQFMQFIPNFHALKLAYHTIDGNQACENTALLYDTQVLFGLSENIMNDDSDSETNIIYNKNSKTLLVELAQGINNDSMEIYSISGKLLAKYNVINGENNLNLDELPVGIYLFHLVESNFTRKIKLD